MNDAVEQIEIYSEEITEDLKIDELDLRDKQMELPALRHKWVGRLIRGKHSKVKLEKLRKETIAENVSSAKIAPIDLSDRALYEKAKHHSSVRVIDEELRQTELLIDYLERVERIFMNMGFDIKNLLEIIKLETT